MYEPDEYAGAKNWKVTFYFDSEEEFQKFKKANLSLEVKQDEDGRYVTFRRPTQKVIKDDLVVFSPPEITGVINVLYVDKDGNRVRQYTKGEKVTVYRVDAEGNEIKDPKTEGLLIGNGSTVLLNFSYYQTGKGAGHRLENLKVLDLVEYKEGPSGVTPVVPKISVSEEKEEKKETKGKKTEVSGIHEDLNDKIPW